MELYAESLEALLETLGESSAESDRIYQDLMGCLKDLEPFAKPKSPELHTEIAKSLLEELKSLIKEFQEEISQLSTAYDELSHDLLGFKNKQWIEEDLFQEVKKHCVGLGEDILFKQEILKIVEELSLIFWRMAAKELLSPPDQKRFEDLCFQLQLLV